jgi:hypothetical protein
MGGKKYTPTDIINNTKLSRPDALPEQLGRFLRPNSALLWVVIMFFLGSTVPNILFRHPDTVFLLDQ